MKLLDLILIATFFVFSSGMVFPMGLDQAQKTYIDRYLQEHGLNRYSDPQGTMYAGGSPLFDEMTGQLVDRYEYILRRNPHILDGFVSILPVEAARKLVASLGAMQNDVDGRKLSDRFLESLVNVDAENTALVESIRRALDEGNYVEISRLLAVLESMDVQRLAQLSGTLRDVRRMLAGPTIQPIDVTEMVRALTRRVEALQKRIPA